MSVFSTYLIERERLKRSAHLRTPFAGQISVIDAVLNLNSADPHILCRGDFFDDEYLYIYCTSRPLQSIVSWVYRKIIFQFATISWTTKDVRIRIMTAMLNTLADKNVISREDNINIQQAIRENIERLFKEIELEQLPF